MFLVEQVEIKCFGHMLSISVHFTVTIDVPQYRKTSETDFYVVLEEVELKSVFLLSTSVIYLSGIETLPIGPYGSGTNLVGEEEFSITFPVFTKL